MFKKKDKRSDRVAAIVKLYGDAKLQPPRELVNVAEREGLVVLEARQPSPAPGPVAVPQQEERFVSDVRQVPSAMQPLTVFEKQERVEPDSRRASTSPGPAFVTQGEEWTAPQASQTPPAPEPVTATEEKRWTAPDVKPAPPSPASAKAPDKDGWVSPAYTHSRQVVLRPKELLANRCVGYLCGSYESESYKVLRTRLLQKTGEQGGTTVMITSALPGEGKTLTAVNLSLTFAKEYNQTVLLVDSDLHKQGVHECLGFESDRGLAEYLLNGTSLADLIVWPGVEKFTVISGGRPVATSSELLSSPRMKELVKDLKSRYPDRYVFFDVPPVLVGADALAFAPQMDHIILVVRAGVTSVDDVRLALDLLPKEKVLGVVLNRAEQVGRYHRYPKDREEPRDGKPRKSVTEDKGKEDKPGFMRKLLRR